jgi:hypothetical protein
MAKSRQKMLAKMDVFEGIVNDPTVVFRVPQPGVCVCVCLSTLCFSLSLSVCLSPAKSRQKMLAEMDVFEGIVNNPGHSLSLSLFLFLFLSLSLSLSLSLRLRGFNTYQYGMTGPVAGGFGIRLVDVGFNYPGQDFLFKGVEFSINQVRLTDRQAHIQSE